MKLILSSVSGIPIYEQIKQQVKAAILSGQLEAGEALPSLRTLAKDVQISVLTVTRAYTELEQGLWEKRPGAGVLCPGAQLPQAAGAFEVPGGDPPDGGNPGGETGGPLPGGRTPPVGHLMGGECR